MIPRYADARITALFSDEEKVARWQMVELAVIQARATLCIIDQGVYDTIATALAQSPCDIAWWKRREDETKHDLAAWVDERHRMLPVQFRARFHEHMTSYDTEDPAHTLALLEASRIVIQELSSFIRLLKQQAVKYRTTVMLDRTHGQWAKLRTFGGRFLTWIQPLERALAELRQNFHACGQSRISGAIGNYGGGMTPDIELVALKILGLTPFYGATQIAPRILHAPLANALRLVAEAVAQIATDFRLGARSGITLWHEPFGKKQKGSSAMPHKKNTINTEQMGGMLIMARTSAEGLQNAMQTWEGRAIEQSCVERVLWPDLFHVTLRMISVMKKVIGGMVVYPDAMLREIHESRGTYASDEAKNFLAEECGKRGVDFEVAYRILQLASFCVFEPTAQEDALRNQLPRTLEEADALVLGPPLTARPIESIRDVIREGRLRPVEALEATAEDVVEWNKLLGEVFADGPTGTAWGRIFAPSELLRNERHLFNEILRT